MEYAACLKKNTSATKSKMQHTDVVIVGNGPSGICLSYFLSGHWPYYNGEALSDKYLQARLETNKHLSLVEQDLEELSEGLEGRSSNPVALLFDSLTHPGADLGQDNPSVLEWKSRPDKAVDHVVLGKTKPGGAWQMMEGTMQTLSFGDWMELPGTPFKQWLKDHGQRRSCQKSRLFCERASMEDVRDYYMEYVEKNGLTKYFKNHATVTSVKRIEKHAKPVNCETGEFQEICSGNNNNDYVWEVCGFCDAIGNNNREEFCYRASKVVLATGTFDLPNKIHKDGENYPYILHSMAEFEEQIKEQGLCANSDPVMVIGAGLTAADAILCCESHGIPVNHVFRRSAHDPSVIYNKLPPKLYPEYIKVLQNMKRENGDNEAYTPYSGYSVLEFLPDNKVIIQGQENCKLLINVSYVLVLIGSKPNLSYLRHDGKDLGIIPDQPIECHHNPIDLDPFSFQSMQRPGEGLFAMGPLTGDNFVRFITGGALGITNHLWKEINGTM